MPDFIEIKGISFTYPGFEQSQRPALANIDLKIGQGESIALIGANGSGKSTLAKMLNALLLPNAGEVHISGMDTRERRHHAAIHAQVGMVFQRPQDQIVATTVEEDVAFGPENMGVPSSEIFARVDEALACTGLAGYRERPSYLLSAGETQRLALAGVLALRPRCIIFDETTAMLDPAGREMVMQQMADLNRQGITTILITHLMQEAVTADRVVVLHAGRLVLDGKPQQVFSGKHVLADYGLAMPPVYQAAETLRKYFPALAPDILHVDALLQALPIYSNEHNTSGNRASHTSKSNSDAIVQIENLSFTYLKNSPLAHQALDRVNMQIQPGYMHGLIGGTGSGKSTILQHINGLIALQSGRARVGELDLSDEALDVRALRRKVSLAFQQPEDQIFEQYVGDEVAYAPRHLGYEGKLADVVKEAMQAVGLDFEAYKDRLTSGLSGGEKRKVALASILAVKADILLLDEPFSGLDPQSNQELIGYLQRIHADGHTLLISTHQYDELIELFDQVSVIDHGKDAFYGSSEEVFSQVAELARIGLKAPLPALIAQRLRQNGWPLNGQIASFSSLENQLENLTRGGGQ